MNKKYIIKSVSDLNVKGKKILLRVDFNVPVDKKGKISNDFRIKKALPTINYLIKQKAKVIILSHFGRPKDREKEFSLKKVALYLQKILKKKVKFINDCIGDKVKKEVDKMREGEVMMLENLRFYTEEKKNDKLFAQKIRELGEAYVNDAFSVCHRKHASVVSVPKHLPRAAGFRLLEELENLEKIQNPKKPLIAIFGGKDSNVNSIKKFLEKAKYILVNHLVWSQIKEGLNQEERKKIIFPIDGKGEKEDQCLLGEKTCDIGPKTIALFKKQILTAKTIFWSGPMGNIKEKKFQEGTKKIAELIIKSRAFSVAGGGDTIDFINTLKLFSRFSFISGGGNAMLDFLGGIKLPGIEVLKKWK